METPLNQYSKIQAMVQKEASDIALKVFKEQMQAYKFTSFQVPAHVHNGIDSPAIIRPDVTYIGYVPYEGAGFEFDLTASLSVGATSATLVDAWAYDTGEYTVTFSSGEMRDATLTNLATTMTWTDALTAPATSAIHIINTGLPFMLPGGWTVEFDGTSNYEITHNLGTYSNVNFYAVVATATQSLNIKAFPVISPPFPNSFNVSWFDEDGNPAATSFMFQLTTGNNKSPFRTQYNTRNL